MPDNPSENDFMEIVTAAVQAERNAGDQRLEDAQSALHAALEDLAKVKQERDGLVAAHIMRNRPIYADESISAAMDASEHGRKIAATWLAAHDRQVAARVLRDASRFSRRDSEIIMLKQLAAQYERGERGVPA